MGPLRLTSQPNLAPMLMPQPTPGMVTMVTEVIMVVTTDHTDIMATMARDLPMREPLLNLAPTPTPRPTPGMDTMVTDTGLTGMDIMVTGHMAMPTGDKKWTSRTTSDLSLPTHLS